MNRVVSERRGAVASLYNEIAFKKKLRERLEEV
jgi:hypothetical protein